MCGLFDFVFGYKSVLYPFEICIIKSIQSHLGIDAGKRLGSQVEKINKVKRDSDGKEVLMYCKRFGRVSFDDNLRFPYVNDESLLATVVISHPENRQKLKAEAWVVNGHLFSLDFNKSPQRFFGNCDLKKVQPEIAEVKIWFDPMHPKVLSEIKSVGEQKFTGWVEDWYSNGRLTDIQNPRADNEIKQFLKYINTRLPTDYMELISQTDGAKHKGIKIYGVGGIRKIVFPNANYYVLAEIEEFGVLAVQAESIDAKLFFLNYGDDNADIVGNSFRDALVNLEKLGIIR